MYTFFNAPDTSNKAKEWDPYDNNISYGKDGE